MLFPGGFIQRVVGKRLLDGKALQILARLGRQHTVCLDAQLFNLRIDLGELHPEKFFARVRFVELIPQEAPG